MQIIFSAGLIVAVVLWGLLSPASLDSVFGELLVSITHNFGWFYLWVVLGLVVLAFFLAFSRYGDLKLGDEDEEPEFSVGAWFSMLFAAGMGIGLVFWGVAEPVSHYVRRPMSPCATPFSIGDCTRGPFTASSDWRLPFSSFAARPRRWSVQ
jgi:glycine betaine transporter